MVENITLFSSRGQNTVMADQLCGHWYVRMTGLQPYLEHDKVESALRTVFKNNVQG